MSSDPPVIVGIDPGTTSAVTVLNHTGELVAATSNKEFSRSEITRFVIDNGRPVLLAVDVTPPPANAEKIASTFGVSLWEPEHDLKTDEKDELAAAYSSDIHDDHIRDALAAARKAYHAYSERIEEALATIDDTDNQNTVTAVVDTAINDPAALHKLTRSTDTTSDTADTDTTEQTDWKAVAQRHIDRTKQKQETIERLRSHLDDVKDERDQLQDENNELEEQQRSAIRESEQYRRKQRQVNDLRSIKDRQANTIASLRETIDDYQEAIHHVVYGTAVMAPIIDDSSDIPDAAETIVIDGDISTALPAHVKTVIVDDEQVEQFTTQGYTVIRRKELDGTAIGAVLIFFPSDAETITDSSFTSWLNEYRERHE